MKIFPDQNYTQVPNDFIEKMMSTLKPVESICMILIMRETFGFHRRTAHIPLIDFIEKLGISRQGALNTISSLEEKKMVTVKRYGDRKTANAYTILTQTAEVEVKQEKEGNVHNSEGVVNSVDQGSQLSRPGVVNSVDPYKERERKYKETTTSSSDLQNEEMENIENRMHEAGVNKPTIERSLRFDPEKIRIALHNTALQPRDNVSAYFFDQLKHGYDKKETEETREEEDRKRRARLLNEVQRRKLYVYNLQKLGENIAATNVTARESTFEIIKDETRHVCGYLDNAFDLVFPGYLKENPV